VPVSLEWRCGQAPWPSLERRIHTCRSPSLPEPGAAIRRSRSLCLLACGACCCPGPRLELGGTAVVALALGAGGSWLVRGRRSERWRCSGPMCSSLLPKGPADRSGMSGCPKAGGVSERADAELPTPVTQAKPSVRSSSATAPAFGNAPRALSKMPTPCRIRRWSAAG